MFNPKIRYGRCFLNITVVQARANVQLIRNRKNISPKEWEQKYAGKHPYHMHTLFLSQAFHDAQVRICTRLLRRIELTIQRIKDTFPDKLVGKNPDYLDYIPFYQLLAFFDKTVLDDPFFSESEDEDYDENELV
jgi:hypothetical protein